MEQENIFLMMEKDLMNTDMNNRLDRLRVYLDDNKIIYKKNHQIKYETYFKMGGVVHTFILPTCLEDLILLLKYLSNEKIKYKILGLTTNVFILDEFEYSIFISTRFLTKVTINKNTIEVECGYSIEDFTRISLLKSSTGYEGLEGIPGSIGGGIIMNAGAYGFTISDHINTVTCLNPSLEVVILNKEKCLFTHRNSLFKNTSDWTILSVNFKIIDGERIKISKKMEDYHIARHSYQEFSYPTLGSLFSVKSDFYREFLKKNIFYYFTLLFLKLIYKNPFIKFIMRKNPNNKIFNKLISIYLAPKKIEHTYSVKSMNILINDGSSKTNDILDYITLLRNHLDENVLIENEIIISPLLNQNKTTTECIKNMKYKGLIA